jgi:hypothetical protein
MSEIKTVREILLAYESSLLSLAHSNKNITQQCKKSLDKILFDLLRILTDCLPCASMTLKLSAKEKYIWLSAVSDCRAALTKCLQ